MTQDSQKAFVTGGTGFIGINLINLLVDEGWDVTALHRPTSDLKWLKQLPVRLKAGSITDKKAVERAIPSDTDVVFHVAGSTNMWSKRNEMQKAVNVGGTRNVVEASASRGVETFIHTSSVAAWGPQAGHITEDTPQKGGEAWVNYEYTKWAGEREALKGCDLGMKVVVLNPAHVTGPYDTNNWGRLFFALRDGDLPAIAKGEASVTHVREVVKAHYRAVEKGRDGNRYLLGGDNRTFEEFVRIVAKVSGIEKLPPKMPDFILKSVARLSEFAASFTGNEPNVTPELAWLMTRKGITYSSKKAIEELDYRIVPLEKSVNDCYKWLKENGYMDGDR